MRLRDHPRASLLAIAGYVGLACLFSWPLPLHLSTHLTGPPDGDTGVYVWNQWVFQHELVEQHSLPLFTREIFSLTRPANLSLHNYTIFQDLLAMPLLRVFDVVTTFNIVYLMMIVLTGYAAFLLAWHVTERPFESWLGGALFSWSPMLVTRGTGHFSLVAAAPLAIFILLLKQSDGRASLRHALALGATVCWAATTDPYYAVYCVMIAVVFLATRTIRVTAQERHSASAPHALDLLLVCVSGLVVSLLVTRGWQFSVLGVTMSVRGLYTPMLLLTLLGLLRLAWPYRHVAISVDRAQVFRLARLASATAVVSAVMLSPVLYAVGIRIRDVGFEASSILWRSSPPGVDLVAFLLPNPNHPLTPAAVRAWLTPRPDLYLENTASLTFVALIAIAFAAWKGWRPPVFWFVLTATFALLSLGPFLHVAGMNTHIPGPWALARYLPFVRLARNPARLAIVLMLAVSVLFAAALCWLGDRWPHRRRALLSTVALVLLFELLPAPRPLYSAAVPHFYARIATAGDVRLLELPVGVRDGTSSVGNFTARSQFFQTAHGKPLIGGYLSRVSRRRIAEVRQEKILNALIELSEGRPLEPQRERALIDGGPEFLRRTRIGFVVIDRNRAPAPLRTFALHALRLERLDGDGALDLYAPRVP